MDVQYLKLIDIAVRGRLVEGIRWIVLKLNLLCIWVEMLSEFVEKVDRIRYSGYNLGFQVNHLLICFRSCIYMFFIKIYDSSL